MILGMRKKSFKKLKNVLFLMIGIGIISFGLLVVWISTLRLPDFKLFTERKIQSSTKIYDRTGQVLLYDVHENIKRTVVPYEQMGTNIKNATVAIEDGEFYQHKGIRISSIIRGTIWAKITGRKVQGGSTITQQLIKNTLLTPEVSIKRKMKEWILAIKLERVMSKDDILALYLNEAPYGGNIYGIEEASKAFFAKEPSELTLAESTYLAAIPNGPTYYSPYRKNKDKLDERKNLVLKRMLDLKFIDEATYEKAKSEVVVFQPERPMNIAAPHFVFFIKDYLEKKYGTDSLESGGYKVITTLDYNLQKKAEEIALEKAKANEKNWNGKNAAVVVIDPKTGQILAMVGSRNYFDKTVDGNFNVATASRQPGSSFKPIVYTLAFEKGYTENTTLFDVRTEFNSSCDPSGYDKGANCYTPSNYDDNFRGPMTLKNALAQSINVPAVKLLYLVGLDNAIKFANDLGITTLTDPKRYGLSLVIGGGETTLLEMVSAYSVFADSGIRHPYKSVLSIEDSLGNKIEEYEDKPYQVVSANSTNILSEILSDDTARTPTFGANSILNIPGREVAVKTGTTNNNKDAWTIGYTPSAVVGVWVGNNDNTPMKKGGAALAGPIWNAVMTEALKDKPVEYFQKPEPINNSIPAFLRGLVFGNDGLVHTILYWVNKENPTDSSSGGKTSDSQYRSWESGVRRWLASNYINTNNVSIISDNTPSEQADQTPPQATISGLSSGVYQNTDNINFRVNTISQNQIKKVDIFVNNTFLKSLKSSPFDVAFTPKEVPGISNSNTITAVVYDTSGLKGEVSEQINIE
jgi:1A family penicillin-binding protein